MHSLMTVALLCFSTAVLASCHPSGESVPEPTSPDDASRQSLPTIFIAGDSTAAPGSGENQRGWGVPFADYFDPEKVNIANRARGGRSSRTFITEGHWDALLAEVKEDDIVLIQFGHNDGGAINREPPGSDRPLRARGSLPGLGEETEAIENAVTGKHEVVHTFGWYMRKMIEEAREKGAHPIVLSPTIRNIWEEGRVERGPGLFTEWSYEVADTANVPFVDVSNLAADRIEPRGPDAMAPLYPQDHTHTNAEGADMHAAVVVAGLKGLRPSPLEGWLSAKGSEIAADPLTWLNLPRPADPRLPTVFFIGDSTVRNGRGDGANGEWGWADFVDSHFDTARINTVNRAVGGLSSRTFLTSGFWKHVEKMLRPGDFVVMQFGHNDSGALNDAHRARGTIRGIGEESETITNLLTGEEEAVHTYGWYLRQYVRLARERGAIPLICSSVPRKRWENDRIVRSEESYPQWAEAVAEAEEVAFIDLYERIARRYDALGKDTVNDFFADAHTHTSEAGARLNAEIFAEGLRAVPEHPLADFLQE